ncbi:MAG: radical SAM protein, partial [Thermodesulfobacteriota bacterium]
MSGGNKIGVISLPINRLHIEVTNHCNFSCEFCPDFRMERKRGFMDPEILKGILNEVAEEGVARLVLFHVMGEPLLYSGLPEAINYAADKAIKTCVTTNGSLLTDRLLDDMIKAGVSRIILSLQTPDEESFRLRGAKGVSFDEYSERVRTIARRVMNAKDVKLTLSFMSSPLRRLIFPVMPEISIADTARDLRWHLMRWSEYILKGTGFENNLEKIHKRLKWIGSFRENSIALCP